MCDIWQVKKADEISIAQVEAWLPEWQQLEVEEVVLSGGEPLMHSEFPRLCQTIKRIGCRLTVLSSGLLLKRFAQTISEECDEVIVSLDGPEDMHNQIRRIPRAFELMKDGIASIRALSPIPIRSRCTVQRDNFAELRNTVHAARSLGVNSISFLATDISSAAFNRPDGWDDSRQSDFIPSAEEVESLRSELEHMTFEMREEFMSGFIVESPAKLERKLLHYFQAIVSGRAFPKNRCNAPWVSAVIDSRGVVSPCFFHRNYGNAADNDSLKETLNSTQARAWRGRLDPGLDEICRKCVCTLFRDN